MRKKTGNGQTFPEKFRDINEKPFSESLFINPKPACGKQAAAKVCYLLLFVIGIALLSGKTGMRSGYLTNRLKPKAAILLRGFLP
ncbi:hypothetical protein [Pseudobacter ginsenosidimutans]|uniref:hypothetical protein n=1 Tax=Pseudobacter ginsenosidimutans TaxID=661488 RepID=UPI00102D9E7F|nr:hypothetical protein [Pseudobacter ginsenosidimutans]QEC44208.1 hypothetical protein FSB84_21970 [Pseudobacter ginsenosidimutans]